MFRTIYSARNAEYQVKATALGTLAPLSPGEVDLCGRIGTATTGLMRAWEYWSMRVAKAGGAVDVAKPAKPAKSIKPIKARPAAKKTAGKKRPAAGRRR